MVLARGGFHRDKGQTVSIGEEFLDLFLVSYGMCFLAFYKAYSALQCYRHLRLVALARNL